MKKKNKIEYYLHDSIIIFLKDNFKNNNININNFIEHIENKIPKHLFTNVDYIYIGEHPDFKERKINAFYRDSAIYTTNDQDNLDDLTDDIVHELAHSLEEVYGRHIYADGEIEKEFLNKREKLYKNVKAIDKAASIKSFYQTEYSWEFDKYLMTKIGYQNLYRLAHNIFVNPYAATSLREYYAVGFETFYLGNKKYLKQVSPRLYEKIFELNEKNI